MFIFLSDFKFEEFCHLSRVKRSRVFLLQEECQWNELHQQHDEAFSPGLSRIQRWTRGGIEDIQWSGWRRGTTTGVVSTNERLLRQLQGKNLFRVIAGGGGGSSVIWWGFLLALEFKRSRWAGTVKRREQREDGLWRVWWHGQWGRDGERLGTADDGVDGGGRRQWLFQVG